MTKDYGRDYDYYYYYYRSGAASCTCQESFTRYCSPWGPTWGEYQEESIPKKKVKRVKSPIPRPQTVAEKKMDKRMKFVLEWPKRRVKSPITPTVAEKTLDKRMKNVLRGI